MTTVLSESQVRFLLFLAEAIVPEVGDLDDTGRRSCVAIIDQALQDRPPPLRRKFIFFLSALRWTPVFRHGVPLDSLRGEALNAALDWFQDCPLPLVRKGFWGLKTLIFMGYYGRPEVGEAIHYTPSFSGNDFLEGNCRD